MIIRTLLFFLVMYLLIKVISRLFLPSANKRRKNAARFFYRNFKQFSQQDQKQRKRQNNDSNSNNFDEIEEAEYEDVTDEEKSSTKSSD